MKIDRATRRAIASEADERAASEGYSFDERAADHVVEFFEEGLVHTVGRWAGEPLEPLPWQRDRLLRPLFGWMNPRGSRRFDLAYVEIPKKNGKSTLAAGIALYLFAADGEPAPQVYCAACDKGQAGIVYGEASRMAKASPLLAGYVVCRDSTKVMAIPSANASLEAITREASSNEGYNIHGLVFDELHRQKTRDLWDALRYGGAARSQPMIVAITTAGFDRTSICYEQHEYARRILDGTIYAPTSFALIYAAAEDDDWTDPEVWAKANPSLGETVTVETMRAQCAEAQESPRKENAFKRYRLNIWTRSDVRWIGSDAWGRCPLSPTLEELAGRPCFLGLDLSNTRDLAALALLFPRLDVPQDPPPGTVLYDLLVRFYCPEERILEREKDDRVPYDLWRREGHIVPTPGNSTDYGTVKRDILELAETVRIVEVAVDRWNSTQLQQELMAEALEVVQFGQGMASMNAPAKEFERLLLETALAHDGNPVLGWNADNVVVATDAADNIRPCKKRSRDKIDGIVAALMALGRAMVVDTEPESSVYEDRGIEYV